MLLVARTLAFTIALSSGGVTAVAFAQPSQAPGGRAAPPPAPAPPGDRLPPRMPADDQPSLTAAQHEQIAALQRQTRQQLAPLREQLRVKRVELRTLWQAEPPSEPAISKKLAEIDALRAAMRPVLVKSRLKSLALLTHEQRLALWRPKGPHESDCCARHMHRQSGYHIAAPRSEEMLPWLEDSGRFELDADEMFELEATPCPAQKPGPPAHPPARGR